MRVCIYRSDKPRERILAEALTEGIKCHGDDAESRPLKVEAAEGFDISVMVGVKSRELFRANWNAGIHTLILDKGYERGKSGVAGSWNYWRTALDGHHPTHYLMKLNSPSDRWERLGFKMRPWRGGGNKVILAGSSEKYHAFYGLEHPTEYAERCIRKIRKLMPDMQVIYRPKPSWGNAVPIAGSTFDLGGSISNTLRKAWALVTHGSNAVFESILAGIPTIVMGDAVSKPISSQCLETLPDPKIVSEKERYQWACNLAYCQWTMEEFQSGEAWSHLRTQLIRHCA